MIEFRQFDLLTLISIALCAGGIYVLWGRKVRGWLFAWRVVNVCAVLFLAFQPRIVSVIRDRRPVFAVAVDVSKSMRLTGRMNAAERFIEKNAQDMDKYFQLKYFAFSEGASEARAARQIASARAGIGTDFSRSLYDIKRDEGERLSGILLLSDGNDNARDAKQSWAGELNVPVFPVSLGEGRKIVDAAVVSVRVGDLAFKGVPVDVSVTLSAVGCAGRRLSVKLSALEPMPRELSRKIVSIGTPRESIDVPFTFTPAASGEYRYRVEVEALPDELTAANNAKTFSIEVVRDKLRVLFLCGSPGPEYAFLRQALKNDPLVELVSFVILRNPENITLASEEDLALIPFPVNDIFTKDIYNFDILILDNFTYRRFGFYPEYLRNIKNWVVEKGGGLVMMGGENSFGSGGWRETPVGDILPVFTEDPAESFYRGLFKLSVADYAHPIMVIDDDPAKNSEAWNSAPMLEDCQTLKIRPGSAELAREKQGGWAVISAREAGKGRVAAIGTNTTWRWALQSESPDFYSRFWKNTVRFAAKKSDERKLAVVFDRPDYFEGQDYQVKVRSIEKQAGSSVEVYLTDPAGARSALPVKKLNDRTWAFTGRFDKSGAHRFAIALKSNGVTLYREERVLKAAGRNVLEETELDLNEPYLKDVASDSGGKYFPKGSFSPKAVLPALKAVTAKEDSGAKPLWDSPWLLALVAASILAELLARRTKGLL